MDVVARLGGDEFAILQVAADAITANELAARVTEAIRLPFDIDGHRCVIGASVGIMIDSDGQTSAEEILRNADLALYEAKAQGTKFGLSVRPGNAVASAEPINQP